MRDWLTFYRLHVIVSVLLAVICLLLLLNGLAPDAKLVPVRVLVVQPFSKDYPQLCTLMEREDTHQQIFIAAYVGQTGSVVMVKESDCHE